MMPRASRRRAAVGWWLRHAWRRFSLGTRAHFYGFSRCLSGTTLYTRTLLGVTAAVCVALLLATASEVWVGSRVQRQVEQVQLANQHLRQDAALTARQTAWAEAPGTIEDEARAMGYVRPGEHAFVIATPQPAAASTPAPARSPAAGSAAQGARQAGWLDWLSRFFGG